MKKTADEQSDKQPWDKGGPTPNPRGRNGKKLSERVDDRLTAMRAVACSTVTETVQQKNLRRWMAESPNAFFQELRRLEESAAKEQEAAAVPLTPDKSGVEPEDLGTERCVELAERWL